MNFEVKKLVCQNFFKDTNRTKDFFYGKIALSYSKNPYDRHIIEKLCKKGNELAEQVNPGAANDSKRKREYIRIRANATAGLIAEYLWKAYLNLTNIDTLVTETPMDDAGNQIDLKTTAKDYSIEVRSSFPRNGLEFALCHSKYHFDIIGPYSNAYKPSEVQKNFYARTLFAVDYENFHSCLKEDNFTVYLTGGATWEMFQNTQIVKKKSFIPEDEINIERLASQSEYFVIPYSHALDTIELYKEIEKSIKQ